jgi:hypothetical protein
LWCGIKLLFGIDSVGVGPFLICVDISGLNIHNLRSCCGRHLHLQWKEQKKEIVGQITGQAMQWCQNKCSQGESEKKI